MNNKKLIDKSYNGLLIIKAKNGNFNAGFDGNPRNLPDGTIFATDKALKYCLREYLTLFDKQDIFVRRNRRIVNDKKKGNKFMYQVLEENFYTKLKDLVLSGSIDSINKDILNLEQKDFIKNWVNKNIEKIKVYEKNSKSKEISKDKKIFDSFMADDEIILGILRSFLDVRLFGVVFAVSGNISLTGPVQISYGINKLESSNIYPVQILSPYRNSNEKSEESSQTTIGEETRADEVYYVYNISVNSANAQQTCMTESDLVKLKEAFLKSVDPITSCTKFGCESIALIWLNNERNFVLNNLDDFIEITKEDNKVPKLNLNKLEDNLKQFKFDGIKKTEFDYDMDLSEKEENLNKIEVIYKKGKIEF